MLFSGKKNVENFRIRRTPKPSPAVVLAKIISIKIIIGIVVLKGFYFKDLCNGYIYITGLSVLQDSRKSFSLEVSSFCSSLYLHSIYQHRGSHISLKILS